MTDPQLLYPLILRIQTPMGLVDFDWREPDLDSVQAEQVTPAELRTLLRGGHFAVAAVRTATRLRITSGPTNALEYAQARLLRALRVGDVVQVTENYTDRYALTVWTNCTVSAPPDVRTVAATNGDEMQGFRLEFVHLEEETDEES